MASSEPGTGTQSLERALVLLREVAAHGGRGARLTDLVQDSGLPKATVRRLLAALAREGLVEQDAGTRRYFLGEETFLLGSIAAARFATRPPGDAALARLGPLSRNKYDGAVPLAALLCDRHADAGQGSAVALQHEDAAGRTTRLTYGELAQLSARFAGVLRQLGVGPGQRVATLLPKGPEFLIAALAAWRLGAVLVPLFAAFGPGAVAWRLSHSGAVAVVTNGTCRGNIPVELRERLPIVTVESDGTGAAGGRDLLFWSTLREAPPLRDLATFAGDDPFVLLYSGDSGAAPKGVLLPVRALAGIEQDMRLTFDVRDDDVFWNIADPGWAVGLYYGVVGPLLLGRAMLSCDGPFAVAQVYRMLARYGVTNLVSPPSWYRRLGAAGEPPPPGLRLRRASSIGGTLPPEVADWVRRELGVAPFDQYGQFEIGVVTCHRRDADEAERAGSVGRPAPGFRLAVLDEAGRELPPGEAGLLVVDVEKSPLYCFLGYCDDPARTAERFRLGRRYYVTGDLGRFDAAGRLAYLGPQEETAAAGGETGTAAEVELALRSHPAVAEASASGRADRSLGEVVRAFVVLRAGRSASDGLADEIAQHAKSRLPPQVYPPEIEFVARLPRKARSLGRGASGG